MLHYCSVADVVGVLSVAERYQDEVASVRDGVTDSINRWIRRTLDYAENITEFHSIVAFGKAETFRVWLEKKSVVASSVKLQFSTEHNWDQAGTDLDPNKYNIVEQRGLIELFGPGAQSSKALRVTYTGGYPEVLDGELEPDDPDYHTGRMACPAALRVAAINQCVYDAKSMLGLDQGKTQENDRGKVVTRVDPASGLLNTTTAAFLSYRKPLAG